MMAMAEFEIQGGSKILLNTNAISSVMEFKKNVCRIFTIGENESPWYVKGTLKEIDDKIWKAERGEGCVLMKTKHGQDLKELLVELYKYYFSISSAADRETEDAGTAYKVGLSDGCIDAVSTIFLALYGSQETLNFWHSVETFGGSEDDKTTGG